MTSLRSIGKWTFILVVSALFIVLALWMISRVVYPTAAQRQAVTEMESWPDYEGENAFALLWTLHHAVPDDRLEDVMAEDARDLAPKPPESPGSVSVLPTSYDLPSAADAYADLTPNEEDLKLFCGRLEPGCLARVREDPERYASLIERNAALLDRVDNLHGYGFIRSEFPYSIWSPMPSVRDVQFLRTRHAVQFAQGQPREAVAATCREMVTWRRLGSRSDSMIFRMLGDGIASRANGQMLADMLAELPVDQPLPEICVEALAPPAGPELSLCNALRGEYGVSTSQIREIDVDQQETLMDKLAAEAFVDQEASLAMRAEGYQALCSKTDDASEQERREAQLRKRKNLWRLECMTNLYVCVANALSFSGYGDFQDRVVDHAARLRALGTLAWMRDEAGQGQSPEALLASRPEALYDEGDQLRFGPEGQTLQISLRWTRRAETWSIPIPPALYSTATSMSPASGQRQPQLEAGAP